MNLKMLESSDQIIYKCIAGSHAYGTNNSDSDIDIRGAFMVPLKERISLNKTVEQVSDSSNDVTFYELQKFFNLLKDNNPNILELLFIPSDCVLYKNEIMDKILENKHLFISKKSKYTHGAYAHAQIKRCKGQNKRVNNPLPKEQPQREDFCWIIPMREENLAALMLEDPAWKYADENCRNNIFPMRPIPISEAHLDLSKCHVAKAEHMENTYRLYNYDFGSDTDNVSKGVFRGNQLVTESIPKEDEWGHFVGFLIYNEVAYKKAKDDHRNYWTWKKERNEARYRSQENGDVNFDCKNVMHCFRLLWSGMNILENGEPIVRFFGERLEFLKDIRAGKYGYDMLMDKADEMNEKLDGLYDTSTILREVDMDAIDCLFRDIIIDL